MAKGTFGERLKRERELREVPLEEIAAATRIAPRFLEALENEQWDKLPGGVFGRGFVRSIARYLGLSEEDLLSEYDLVRGESAAPAAAKPEERIPSAPKWIPAALVLGMLVALAGLVIGGRYAWRVYTAHRAQKKTSATTRSPATTVVATPSSANAANNPGSDFAATGDGSLPLQLTVAASAVSRVRVIADDTVAYDSGVEFGQTLHFTAGKKFEVTAANSSAVLLELNGRELPPFGMPGSSGTILLTAKDLRPTNGATRP